MFSFSTHSIFGIIGASILEKVVFGDDIIGCSHIPLALYPPIQKSVLSKAIPSPKYIFDVRNDKSIDKMLVTKTKTKTKTKTDLQSL